MAKLHIFGSLSGTEPFPGRHHCSFAVDINGALYWFDAGENCSHTAHNMGLDLLNIREIFISHTHMDHIGGLGNLLWNIRKLTYVHKLQPTAGKVEVVLPVTESFDGVMAILRNSEGGYACEYPTVCRQTTEGLIFDDGTVKVTAVQNAHLAPGLSYSFLIEFEGKRVIFTGDVKHPSDCLPLIGGGVDIFMAETGHHHPADIARWLDDENIGVGTLLFIHHGRRLLDEYDTTVKAVSEVWGRRSVIYAEDAMTIEI